MRSISGLTSFHLSFRQCHKVCENADNKYLVPWTARKGPNAQPPDI